jgi:hypothetical protein
MKKLMSIPLMIAKGIGSLVTSIFKGIWNLITGIGNLFVSIAKGFVKLLKVIYQSFVSLYGIIVDGLYKMLVVPFLPSYKVVFSLYNFIPGIPVNKNDSIHAFGKGKGNEAKRFFEQVVNKTAQNRIIPAEVQLIKRKKVVANRQFGPVNDIKIFM